MTQVNACNCIVCAKEFDSDELQSIVLSKINVTRFKICQACLDASDPASDYSQVREIISSYLWFAETKGLFKDALNDVKSIKK
jgi:hypothetical protein